MKRIFAITLLIIAMSVVPSFADYTDYQILDQGNSTRCSAYSVSTYLDIIGDPIDPNELYDSVMATTKYPQYTTTTMGELLDYCIAQKYITGFHCISVNDIRSEIDKGNPVLIWTYVNQKDWRDGNIYSAGNENVQHWSVITGYTEDYLIGANSWGTNYGYAGYYYMYNTDGIVEAIVFVLVPAGNSIY